MRITLPVNLQRLLRSFPGVKPARVFPWSNGWHTAMPWQHWVTTTWQPRHGSWRWSSMVHPLQHSAAWQWLPAMRGTIDHAIDLYQRAIELSPDEAEAQYQLALLLVAVDPASALPVLMQVSSLDPDREAEIREIRKEINRALLVPDTAYQYTLAGRLLGSLNEWDLAGEAFRRALSFNSQYAEAWAWLAEAKQSTGSDGRAAMEKALALDPESPGIHGLDGLIWMQMGRPEDALAAYEKAATLEPENAIWQISLGDASTAAGDISDALQYYYRAVELAPRDPSTWRALALFSLNNDIDVAQTGLTAAEGLSRLAPEDWLTYLVSGRVSMMLNNPLAARTNFLKAIEAAPEEPAPHYYLGLSFMEAQMFTLAYDKLVDVISLDPTGMYGWQAQRLLEVYFP